MHHDRGPRICIVGTSGSGKTTVARVLGAQLGLPCICNDAILWKPNWVLRPKPEFHRLMDEATSQSTWTLDGNLGGSATDQMALARATAVVWLDLPWSVVMRQIVVRTLRRVALREKLFSGNVETFGGSFLRRDSIILWAATTHEKLRRRYSGVFDRLRHSGVRLVRLRSRWQVDQWLQGVRREDLTLNASVPAQTIVSAAGG